MQKLTITRLVVMLFALTLLASGCAKKPVAEQTTMTEQPAQVEVQQQQPAGVAEQSVTDTGAGSYDAAAAARAAENAATSGLQRIHFDFDQYVLTDAAKTILVNNAGLLRAAPAIKVLIEGHCDERGSDEYNLALGEKRALATKNYLVSLGVPAERLSVISYGEEMPLDGARTKEAWAKNRRADFKVKR
ncbi:MAG: peptidoglycan-associated lipoprotein Pal [Desulfuromonadales bacterium]|nr:peptidoglycan-associated lipoprotein Pal [Desulfuromonadales bacterium]MBN2791640.1 peptidoglycan-associated lipoprotein Pal [Desulfuromonadales bacterium]